MKFVEKASGWLFAIGLAVALVLMFNYLDVLILMGFRNSGIWLFAPVRLITVVRQSAARLT